MKNILKLIIILLVFSNCQEKPKTQKIKYDFGVQSLWEPYLSNDFNLKGNVHSIIQKHYDKQSTDFIYLDSIIFNEFNKILIEKKLEKKEGKLILTTESKFTYNEEGNILEAQYNDYEEEQKYIDFYSYDGKVVNVSRKEGINDSAKPYKVYTFNAEGKIDNIEFLEPYAKRDVETYYYNKEYITFKNNAIKGAYFFIDSTQQKLKKFQFWRSSRNSSLFFYTYDSSGNIETIIDASAYPADTTTFRHDYDDKQNWLKEEWNNAYSKSEWHNSSGIYIIRELEYRNE